MKIIEKYGLAGLIFSNLLVGFEMFHQVGNILFYIILVFGCFLVLSRINIILNSSNKKRFGVIMTFLLVHICYQVSFGLVNSTIESWNYILAKVTVLCITIISLYKNFDFYHEKFVIQLSCVIAILLVLGFLTGNQIYDGRMTMGFGNPNNASAIASIAFIGFLMVDLNKIHKIGAVISILGVLMGGSRTCLAMCLIVACLKYGLSLKTILLYSLIFVCVINILSALNIKIVAFDRFIDVFETGNFTGSREDPRKATMMMISEKPITGWGFKSGIQGEAADITQLGSHNGYLDMIKSMGYPFALTLYLICLSKLYPLKVYLKSTSEYDKYYFAVTVLVLGSAMYESYLIGVNNFTTNMFFVSIGVLEYGLYSGKVSLKNKRI